MRVRGREGNVRLVPKQSNKAVAAGHVEVPYVDTVTLCVRAGV